MRHSFFFYCFYRCSSCSPQTRKQKSLLINRIADEMNRWSKQKDSLNTPASEATIRVNYSAPRHILEVEFKGGKVYEYLQVELQVWEEYKTIIQTGGSSGFFVNKRIKPYYKAREITK